MGAHSPERPPCRRRERITPLGRVAAQDRQRSEGKDIGRARTRQYRQRGRPHRACLRHEGYRLERKPHRGKAAAVGAKHVRKDELFRQSDVLTIHLVLSRRSRGLVGAAELALMKSTAWLVNTSRAPIVDDNALTAALRERRIAG